jgi:hypothetical protein
MSQTQRADTLSLKIQKLESELHSLQRSVNFANGALIPRTKAAAEAELGEIYIDSTSSKLSWRDLSGTIHLINTTP